MYVTGNFTYEADFGDGSLRAPNGFGSGAFFGADMFVVKYDTDGSTQWVDTFGATDNDGGLGIAVDASGDPHVTGYFKGSVTFGATTLTAASSFGTAFVAKLNRASGGAIWAKSGAPFTSGNAIAVDSAGNSYVAGVSVLAKFDGDPNHPKPLWYAAILGSIVSFGVAIDTAGNSYITGSFFGTINFFPPTSVWPPPCLSLLCLTGTQVAPGNTLALFTAKFDSAGRVSYFNHVGTTGPSALETGGIAVAGGNFYTTGSFGGVASFPYNAPVVTLASAGEFDVFRAQYAGTAGATHFDLSGLPQQPVTAGNSFFFTVTALDASNNIVPGYTGTVQLTSNDPRAVFLPTAATLTNGTGQFSASLRTAGSNVTITATDANIASIQGTSGPIVVNPGPATHFEFVGFPQSTTAGAPITFTLRALDAANNLATGYQGTALVVSDRVNTTGASGQLSAGQRQFTLALTKPGEILIATDTQNNSITGTSPAIVVSPGPAARLAIFVALPIANGQFAAAAGSPFNLTVSVRDLFDNSVASFGGLVQFTSTDPNRILPPDSPVPNGLGTFKAGTQHQRISDNHGNIRRIVAGIHPRDRRHWLCGANHRQRPRHAPRSGDGHPSNRYQCDVLERHDAWWIERGADSGVAAAEFQVERCGV